MDVYRLRLGQEDSVRLGEFMYSDASLFLQRKRDQWTPYRRYHSKVSRWSTEELEMARRAGVEPLWLINGGSTAGHVKD